MLGRTLDTKLFRLLSHDRNLKTEEQILGATDELALNMSYVAPEEVFLKVTNRSGRHFDWRGKKILDIACGSGDLVNHLAMNGAATAVGIDIQAHAIKVANAYAAREGISNVKFVAADFHNWDTAEKFDYVLSYQALDHIPDIRATMKKMASLAENDGKIINFAGGFWRGPIGADHCDDFMRFPIPWTQLLFSDEARLTVRREKFRPNDPATAWSDIRGGLSMYTYAEYMESIGDAGLQIDAWDVNYQLKYIKRGRIVRPLSAVVTRVPRLGEYFIFSVMSVLSKARRGLNG